jgi:enoyl-CoA hydratase/carnithine racemase
VLLRNELWSIILDRAEGIATMTLSHPDKLNAVSPIM